MVTFTVLSGLVAAVLAVSAVVALGRASTRRSSAAPSEPDDESSAQLHLSYLSASAAQRAIQREADKRIRAVLRTPVK